LVFYWNYYSNESSLAYIGSSKNLFKRVSRGREVLNVDFPILPIVFIKTTTDYIRLEKRLIKKFRPDLNKQHR